MKLKKSIGNLLKYLNRILENLNKKQAKLKNFFTEH